MSFRRFVYLVTDDVRRRNFSLRRIDMSRFFLPTKGQRDGDPPQLEEAELPQPEVKFGGPPTSVVHDLQFMLFPSGGSRNDDKVVVSDDLTGRVLLYDTGSCSIRSAPSFTAPKLAPVSMAVGGNNSHYVLGTKFTLSNRSCCFDRFSHDDDWRCRSLRPPPYVHTNRCSAGMSHVDSYAVVGGSNIWISNSTFGTHCFDTASWVWTKAGDWMLPFWGHVQYVPEHKLWFGIPSSSHHGCDDDGSICTSDLTVTPPTIRKVWGDDDRLAPPEWTRKSCHLVHLGKSKFCHARFFQIKHPVDLVYTSYAVFTGMEAEPCGNNAGGGELRMVKHRSEIYKLANKLFHWVL